MGLFGLSTKVKRGRPKKRPKTIKEILSDAYLSELKKDPELAREISLRDAGHAEVLDRDRETETNKKQIKKFVTSEALKKIQGDPELAEQFITSQIDDILSEGKPSKGRRSTEPEYYGEGPMSVGQIRENIAELEALKSDLGAKGNGSGILNALADPEVLKGLLALLAGNRQQEIPVPEPIYVVKVDGRTVNMPKSQYDQFCAQGRVGPVAEIAAPKEARALEETSIVASKPKPELPAILQDFDFSVVADWMELEPEEFVTDLKSKADDGEDMPRLLWGFMTTANYEGIVSMITPYKDNPKVSTAIEKVLSDEGKVWLEKVLELVKEYKKEE